MVSVENLKIAYESTPVLDDVSLKVSAGETLAVLGPSGCGKTTLLYAIAGLRIPSDGKITVAGEKPTAGRRDTAVVLQDYGLLPWKTVRENVALGLKIRKLPEDNIVQDTLDELDLTAVADHYPSQLSGGQRQRVAIGRALAVSPRLLLMDEPFSALDAITRESLQDLFLNLWHKHPMTAFIVTHSIEEAVFLGKRIVVLSGQPGRIISNIKNPSFGDKKARQTEAFYHLCRSLRSDLQKDCLV